MSIWSAMMIVIFVLYTKTNNKLKSHGALPLGTEKVWLRSEIRTMTGLVNVFASESKDLEWFVDYVRLKENEDSGPKNRNSLASLRVSKESNAL